MTKTHLFKQRKTLKVYPLDQIKPLIAQAYQQETQLLQTGNFKPYFFKINKDRLVKINSKLRTFHTLGYQCINCQMIPSFVVERIGTQNRSVLYFVQSEDLVCNQLTADHVVPESLGGPSERGNLVPLCTTCNCRKDNNITHLIELKYRLRDLFEFAIQSYPQDKKQIEKRYEERRFESFGLARTIPCFNQVDSFEFLKFLTQDKQLSYNLDQLPHLKMPLKPDQTRLKDTWLLNLANRTQIVLDNDKKVL